jgi:hypothetical protein
MKFENVNFNEAKILALIILLVSVLGTALVKIKTQQAELVAEQAKVQVLSTYLTDFTRALPLNNAQWWQKGCQSSLDELMERLGKDKTSVKVEVFALKIGCEQKAAEVEAAFADELKKQVEDDK